MVKKTILVGLPFVLAGLLAAGCGDDTTSSDGPPAGVTNEEQAITALATGDSFVQNEDQTFGDASIEPMDYGTFGKIAADVIPVSWGRFVEEVTVSATTTIADGDSIATVNVVRNSTGTFRVLAKQTPEDTAVVLIEKPFADQSVRNVIFRRIGRDGARFWLNWIPVSTSLVDGKTVNPPEDQTVTLTELQLVRPSGDTITITDPTNFYLRYPWSNMMDHRAPMDVPEMSFGESFSIRATVVSSSPDTDLVALKYGFSPASRRRMGVPMISQTENGDGTFTRVYGVTAEVRHQPGFFHAGVVVLSHKTLYDDDPASYSVNWWGVPYRVR